LALRIKRSMLSMIEYGKAKNKNNAQRARLGSSSLSGVLF
jgi:hypothetical protein